MKLSRYKRLSFKCKECGYKTLKYLGKCPSCNRFNTLELYNEPEAKFRDRRCGFGIRSNSTPQRITELSFTSHQRLKTGINELDRVLGGGLVPGSVILIGGDPGIGKSTLLLQTARSISNCSDVDVLYVSGEESEQQIRMRAERLNALSDHIRVFTNTDVDEIIRYIRELQPRLAIIDSVQTMVVDGIDSAPGSVSQITESASRFVEVAKTTNVSIILVGHVTKNGSLGGPKTLEHMVDTVLYFEGDNEHILRILRSTKNRFGNTNEVGIFEMKGEGLVEVENPSVFFTSSRNEPVVGSATVVALEGTRPLIVEVQALTPRSYFPNPRHEAIGVDSRRLSLILAILQQKADLSVHSRDVYVNAVGGVRLREPACDLGIAVALMSSVLEQAIPDKVAFIGEVGLLGEIRPVPRLELRVKETLKLGFQRIYVSRRSDDVPLVNRKQVIPVETVKQVKELLFPK